MLNIIVCIKQVPEITEVKIDPKTHTLIREGVPNIVNPFDEFAVEEAIRIKEKHSAEVTVITMGPPQARSALMRALAMGADRAILISDKAFAGSDTFVTAYTLAKAIKKLNFDIILCGKQAIDGDTAQVPPELAEQLGIPQITYIKKLEVYPEKKEVIVHREIDEGYEIIRCRFPVLLTAIKGLNEPRIPTYKGIMSAKRKELKIWGAGELIEEGEEDKYGLKGSPTFVEKIFTPTPRKGGTVIEGDDETIVKKLVQYLLKEQAI
jgi:electron transfer flavoprotein beta subunit